LIQLKKPIMKKLLLTAMVLLPMLSFAQMVVISDDFESYNVGDALAATSDVWVTWSGQVASEDALISDDQAFSGNNSVHIEGSTTDLVLPFPSDYTSGIYSMSLKIFVVGGNGAYFNYQQSSTPGVEWMFEIYFDAAGTGTINAGGLSAATFTYTPDSWTDFDIIVDLDNDSAGVSIDSNSAYQWQWSQTATGGGTDAPMWGGMNIYAAAPAGQTPDFYIDDVVLVQIFATGFTPNEASAILEIAPNPSNGSFAIRGINIPAGEYRMDVVDMLGKIVSTETMEVSGSFDKTYDLDVANGVYFVTLTNGSYSETKKITIK
jgi:hypothetical protein